MPRLYCLAERAEPPTVECVKQARAVYLSVSVVSRVRVWGHTLRYLVAQACTFNKALVGVVGLSGSSSTTLVVVQPLFCTLNARNSH